MEYPKRSQYKYAKSRYRVRNWPEYEASLQRQGNLTVWLSGDALDSWRAHRAGHESMYLALRLPRTEPVGNVNGLLRASRIWCWGDSLAWAACSGAFPSTRK